MRPVVQYTLKNEFIKRFDSIKEAAHEIECSEQHILHACAGRKKTCFGFIWRYETEKEKDEMLDEEYKQIRSHPSYLISESGKIYSTTTSQHLSKTDRKDGYVRTNIQGSSHYVHKLVAEAFLEPPDKLVFPVVNHKDGNKSNNHVSNLEWVQVNENILHAHRTGLNSTSRSVIRYNLRGEEIGRYRSIMDASKSANVSHTSISQACKKVEGVYTIADSIWRFDSEPLDIEELRDMKPLKRKVVQYSLEGEKIKEFVSISEAAKSINVHTSVIIRVCQGKANTSGGYVWKYEGDEPPVTKVKRGSAVKVEQLTMEGAPIKIWTCISDAARSLNISDSHISSVCKGKRKSTGGFRWRYVE